MVPSSQCITRLNSTLHNLTLPGLASKHSLFGVWTPSFSLTSPLAWDKVFFPLFFTTFLLIKEAARSLTGKI